MEGAGLRVVRMQNSIPLLHRAACALLLAILPSLQAADTNPTQERADRFLALVNSTYQAMVTLESNAQWDAGYMNAELEVPFNM